MYGTPRTLRTSLLIAAAIFGGCAATANAAIPRANRAAWLTYHDRGHRFVVDYPSRWIRANVRLTPFLSNPREVLTIATFPLRPGGPRCAQFPTRALSRLESVDVLLSIQEQFGIGSPSTSDFRPKPTHVALAMGHRTEAEQCVTRPRFVSHMIGFSQAGRRFLAFIAIGTGVPAAESAVALRVIDSFIASPSH